MLLHARKVDSGPSPPLAQRYPGYLANDFGLYHTLGNLSKWTANVYNDSYLDVPKDGNVAVAAGNTSFHIVRGGNSYSSVTFEV